MPGRHDPAQSRLIWPPSPGLFRLRLVKGAWAVPARILFGGLWQAEIDEALNAPHADAVLARGVDTIWHGGLRIDQDEYDWLIATKRHAEAHDPSHPCLHPTRAIDRSRLRAFRPHQTEEPRP
jgi:hypothetical protein